MVLRGPLLPLRRGSIHDDIDPEDLHGIEGVGEVHEGGQGDEGEGSNTPTVVDRRQQSLGMNVLSAGFDH